MRDLHYLMTDSSGARMEWVGHNGREQWIPNNVAAALEMEDSETRQTSPKNISHAKDPNFLEIRM